MHWPLPIDQMMLFQPYWLHLQMGHYKYYVTESLLLGHATSHYPCVAAVAVSVSLEF